MMLWKIIKLTSTGTVTQLVDYFPHEHTMQCFFFLTLLEREGCVFADVQYDPSAVNPQLIMSLVAQRNTQNPFKLSFNDGNDSSEISARLGDAV